MVMTFTVSRHKQSAAFSFVCDVSLTPIYARSATVTDDDVDAAASVNDACVASAAAALAMVSMATSSQCGR